MRCSCAFERKYDIFSDVLDRNACRMSEDAGDAGCQVASDVMDHTYAASYGSKRKVNKAPARIYPSSFVWIEHNYFRSFVTSCVMDEKIELANDIGEEIGPLGNERSRQSGHLQVEEKLEALRSVGFCLEGQVPTAESVGTDHNYSLVVVESENETRDVNQFFIKEEPMDEEEGNGIDEDHEMPEEENGQLQVKEEPGLARSFGCGLEARIPTATDVWLDHSYNRAIGELEKESQDLINIRVKEEPIDADENDGNGDLPAMDKTNSGFPGCELVSASIMLERICLEHCYASPLVKDEPSESCPDSLTETDPLSLDQGPEQCPPNTEDRSVLGQDPSEDFHERLCTINDKVMNRQGAGSKNIEVRENLAGNEQSHGYLQVNTDNMPIFQCRLCQKSFDSYREFDCHFSLVHSKSSNGCNFSCKICASTFSSCEKLIGHMKLSHLCQIQVPELLKKPITSIPSGSNSLLNPEEVTLHCRACLDFFECEADLKIHLLLDKCTLSCIECHQAFQSEDILRMHKLHFHSNAPSNCGRKVYKCSLCNIFFKHPGHLLKHLIRRNCEKKLTCEFCGSTFSTADHMEAHINSFACRHFDGRTSGLAATQEASNTSVTGVVHCHLCKEIFSCETDLTRHFTSRHIDFVVTSFCYRNHGSGYSCVSGMNGHCEVKLMPSGVEMLHSIMKRPEVPEKYFACNLCDKTFISKIHLQSHKATHKLRLDVSCVECEKCFTLTSNLGKHLKRCQVPYRTKDKVPTEIIPAVKVYKPTLIIASRAKLLDSPPELQTYAKSQLSSTNFTCDLCKMTVLSKRELREHLKSHVAERNFGCLECKEYFTYAVDFMHHTRRCSEKFVKQNKMSLKLPRVMKKRRSRAKKRS